MLDPPEAAGHWDAMDGVIGISLAAAIVVEKGLAAAAAVEIDDPEPRRSRLLPFEAGEPPLVLAVLGLYVFAPATFTDRAIARVRVPRKVLDVMADRAIAAHDLRVRQFDR